MLAKLSAKLSSLSLEWRYRIAVVAVILLTMLLIQVSVTSSEYTSDKHSTLVNLAVLTFTVLVVEVLATAKATIVARRGDEQRILGFHQMLSVYLHRYLQAATAMTHPLDSYVGNSAFDLELKLKNIEFPDMENMYNISLNLHVPMNTKCYTLYFNAAAELGDAISRGLAYVYSSHYTDVANILIALATNNNHLDIQMLHEGFKARERCLVGAQPQVDHDREFLQGIRLGTIKQTVDFIESNSHGLNSYARVYKFLKANVHLIKLYDGEVANIIKKQ